MKDFTLSICFALLLLISHRVIAQEWELASEGIYYIHSKKLINPPESITFKFDSYKGTANVRTKNDTTYVGNIQWSYSYAVSVGSGIAVGSEEITELEEYIFKKNGDLRKKRWDRNRLKLEKLILKELRFYEE